MYHVFIGQSVPGTTVFTAARVRVIMDQHGCALFLVSLVFVLCDLLENIYHKLLYQRDVCLCNVLMFCDIPAPLSLISIAAW